MLAHLVNFRRFIKTICMEKFNPSGVGVAMVTPFNEDFSIDYESLEKIISHIIKNGADYIVVLGTTGEAAMMSHEEKCEVIKFVKSKVDGRIPLVLGYGGCNTMEMVKSFKDYDLEGFSAILTVTPYYVKPSQDGLFSHYSQIAGNSPLPVLLYNVPGRTGVNMLSSTTLRLAREVPNILGIKEASGKLFQIEEILKGRPEGFMVLSGDDALTLHIGALGGEGVISVMANAYPRQVSELIRYSREGKIDEARRVHFKLKDLNRLLFCDGNPAGIKYVLSKMGLCKNILRLPLTPVSPQTALDIDSQIEKIG